LAALFNISANNAIKLLYGTAISTPNIRHNTTRLDYSLGNPDVDIDLIPTLQPSYIKTSELQYNGLIGSNLIVNISGFLNQFDNLIESSGMTLSDGRYVVVTNNSGKTKTVGLEAGFKLRALEKLELNASFSYQKTENQNEGFENIEMGYTPKLLAYYSAAYHITNKINTSINGYYVGKMKTSWQGTPTEGNYVGNEVPAYFVLNYNLNFRNIQKTGIYTEIHVSNVLNSEIRYAVDPSNTWADKGFLGMTRWFEISIGYEF